MLVPGDCEIGHDDPDMAGCEPTSVDEEEHDELGDE